MWFSVGELASAGSYRVFLVESFSSKAGWIASMIVGEAGCMIAATDNNFENIWAIYLDAIDSCISQHVVRCKELGSSCCCGCIRVFNNAICNST